MHLLSLLLLAFAVSLDGFGAGVTYGLRKIRIPASSILIIACCSGFVIWLSMAAGSIITSFLPPAFARLLGAFILIGVGTWAIWPLLRNRSDGSSSGVASLPADDGYATPVIESVDPAAAATASMAMLVKIELKRYGLVIQILRTPQAADVDRSGTISPTEAMLLGTALSLDALGAGLGAAMLGFQPLLTALFIAASSGLFLLGGLRLGFRYAGLDFFRKLSILPGLILVIMGITRLL